MNIGIYIINSKDKNAECGNTKNSTSQIKKKNITIYRFYNNIQRPIKRERVEGLRERQREVKEEYKDSRGEREQECEREETTGHKKQSSGANQRGQRIKHVTDSKLCIYKVL